MTKAKLLLLTTVLASSLLLSGCGKKTAQVTPTPTPPPKLVEIPIEQRPLISLTPREDGHMLFLTINGVPSNIVQIEYELLYTATDNGNELEKGIGDTIREITSIVERKLLLGTESCTNGCKYKYDEGITGGTLSLTFTTSDGQVSTYETPFAITSGKDLKKSGAISLSTENLNIKTQVSDSNYYVLIKNYGIPKGSNAKVAYSLYSSAKSSAKYLSIEPATVTKADTALTGDYIAQ